MTYTTYLIICLFLIAANLYTAKVNTDIFYKLMARKKYDEANGARIQVAENLLLSILISVLFVIVLIVGALP